MSVYPLQSVLELRRREEDAAAARLADATHARLEAEQLDARWVADLAAAKQHLERARSEAAGLGHLPSGHGRDRAGQAFVVPASTAAAAGLFVERRRQDHEGARARLATFRRGALARARAAEIAARDEHLTARRAREAFEKHAAKHEAAGRVAAARREDENQEDIARALRHARQGGADAAVGSRDQSPWGRRR
jgi:hypothetical protein